MAIIIIGIIAIAYLLFSKSASAQTNDTGVNVYMSDGSLTGTVITADQSTWPGNDAIWNICAAIALAEGYNDGPGYVPYDLNNPGDISDWKNSYGSAHHSGSDVTTFPTAEIGWQKLYNKVSDIVNGRSLAYPKSYTWTQVASVWAGNSTAWLNNVISYLGVDANSRPSDYVGGFQVSTVGLGGTDTIL